MHKDLVVHSYANVLRVEGVSGLIHDLLSKLSSSFQSSWLLPLALKMLARCLESYENQH